MAELIFFFYTSIAEFGLQKIYGELPSDSLRKQSASFLEGDTTLNEKTLFQLKFIYIHTSFSSLKCTYIVSKALNLLMLRSRIDSCVCDEMSHRKPLLRHDLELYCGRQQCKQAPR